VSVWRNEGRPIRQGRDTCSEPWYEVAAQKIFKGKWLQIVLFCSAHQYFARVAVLRHAIWFVEKEKIEAAWR
jgi:hypothetical protein